MQSLRRTFKGASRLRVNDVLEVWVLYYQRLWESATGDTITLSVELPAM